MSISNMYYEIGPLRVMTDGYFTRIPQSAFFGGGGGLANTRQPYKPDVAAVTRVMKAIGGPASVNLLLTGHSHFDHSFDTATWSALTGARIIGSKTTCLQAQAERIPADRCTAVSGGETLHAGRRRHDARDPLEPQRRSGDESRAAQRRRADRGAAARSGDRRIAGGRRRGFPQRRRQSRVPVHRRCAGRALQLVLSELRKRRRSPRADRRGRPELRRAARQSRGGDEGGGSRRVDLWIGTGGRAVAALVLPVIKPKAYLPVHWDGLYGAFEAGVPRPYADAPLEELLVRIERRRS